MNIKDYIEVCIKYAKKKRKLPRGETKFNFLYLDSIIKKDIIAPDLGVCRILYKGASITLNKKDKLSVYMHAYIFPRAPFYTIFYRCYIEFPNRPLTKTYSEDIELWLTTEDDIFNLFTKEREYLSSTLKNHNYNEVNLKYVYTRIPLVNIEDKLPSQFIICSQPYVERLLTCGVEYTSRYRRRLSPDYSEGLVQFGDEVISLIKHTVYNNGRCIVDNIFPKMNHIPAIEYLDFLSSTGGGYRINDKENAYVWSLGEEKIQEGDVTIDISTYVYISAYLKIFYIQVNYEIYVKRSGFPKFRAKTINFDGEAIFLGEAVNRFEACILKLEELGYCRQKDLKYKLPVQVAGTLESKELEIGEIFFGLKPDEYSFVDTVEKL